MPVTRMNHAVLYVRDVAVTAAFYQDLLDFRPVMEIPGRAVFLQAPGSNNDHDLGLFAIGTEAGPSEAGRRTVGLYHIAWEVDTLDELVRLQGVLAEAGALVGHVRPRHDEGAVRARPGRPRARGELAAAGRPDHARCRDGHPTRSTWPARSSATAVPRAAESASRSRRGSDPPARLGTCRATSPPVDPRIAEQNGVCSRAGSAQRGTGTVRSRPMGRGR